ncbi:formamidopyrimidine-DNA glycosylase [Ophiocordyceps sinensis CO18]|uniref:Formamidopyrimidine-DNA glycosylase n=1 Tax=Ophiocordyceps sinensis (strain Co18 / CGMCC 3.14243) TaxID=911162 RepID=T5ADI5_OPHSC|nr:formamidopyrimidine-DNA glycosylase [Ophiocordyceps sinensis CO18]
MPEIAEVARIVHFLRMKLVGQRIATASAIDDANVFGKVGTSGSAVEAALRERKVMSAGSQGKYFWIILDKPPHLVMHFGMTGWVHIKGERTAYTNYYKKTKDGELNQWPPKFWKFHVATEGRSPVEVAFTDPRRFGRVRLVDCPGASIREHSPLVENGPDPVVDVAIFTEEYLRSKMKSRHVPIKALLLDQTTISGIGNWVADETLYHAKLHPEQYCDDFDDEAVAKLYQSIRYHWLFNYRWGKGNKGSGSAKLPNGERLAFMTVGGRTSCYAPGVQKKTGRVTTGAKVEPIKAASEEEAKAASEEEADGPAPKKRRTKQTKSETKQEAHEPKGPDVCRRSARLRR